MRALRSSRIAKFAAVTAAALGLAAGAAGSADAATSHTSPWLTGSQMPQNGSFHWQAEPQHRWTSTGEFQWLFTCGQTDPTHELHSSSVSLEPFATKVRGVQGGQVLFHFSNAAKTRAALRTIESDYATCLPRLDRMTDLATGKHSYARIDRTAWLRQGVSYRVEIRNAKGRPAEVADLPSDAQEFFVQRGNTISFIQIEGTNAHLDVTKGSRGVLTAMAARLG